MAISRNQDIELTADQHHNTPVTAILVYAIVPYCVPRRISGRPTVESLLRGSVTLGKPFIDSNANLLRFCGTIGPKQWDKASIHW